MRAPADLLRALLALRDWPVSALALLLVMLLAPTSAVLVASAAGESAPPSVVAIVVVLSVGFAIAPDSGAGLLTLGVVVAWWSRVDDALHPSILVAALLLLLAHLAGLLAAYGPGGVPVDARLGSRWAARGALVLVAAPLVWLVARVADEASAQVALWQTGLLVATLLVAGVAVALNHSGSRPADR
ncbi:hypothetical protein [Nocardioides sp.]|uniref:hypothetical protein n=1 Tax=Nocardioides sp. TaxID=35761 RepID=UPI002B278DB7|nr:hypothetical protein [Nocardioides sp.]